MSNSPRLLSIIVLVLVVLISLAGCDAATTLPGLSAGDEMLLDWCGVYDEFPNSSMWFIPPKDGQVYYNSLEKRTLLWIENSETWEQGSWNTLTKDESVHVWLGTSPNYPTSPSHGDLFFDSVARDSYIYDGTTWKLITSIGNYSQGNLPNWRGSLPAAPDNPSEDCLYHDETSDLAYRYSDGEWKVISIDGQTFTWLGIVRERPVAPSPDDLSLSKIAYRDTNNGNTFIWFNSSFWRVGNFLELHYDAPQT